MNRRSFLKKSAEITSAGMITGLGVHHDFTRDETGSMSNSTSGSVTDVEGIKVGHFTDTRRPTGCTVIMAEQGAVGADSPGLFKIFRCQSEEFLPDGIAGMIDHQVDWTQLVAHLSKALGDLFLAGYIGGDRQGGLAFLAYFVGQLLDVVGSARQQSDLVTCGGKFSH